MKEWKAGVIGLGARGSSMLKSVLLKREDLHITAVCDLYEDRAADAAAMVREKKGNLPFSTTDAEAVITRDDVEIVFIFAAWEAHIPLTVRCMEAGKPVAVEVAGAYSVDQCFDLVRAYERTKTPVFFLENCCFGRRELMVLNMARQGVFGEIVHCDGGYCHDLRDEVAYGEKNRHYRLRNYLVRNCENYPTHQLGPIFMLLDMHRGNRFLTLQSVASKSAGLHEFIRNNMPEDPLCNAHFAQGDIITTIIKCAGGQTIRLTLDTTLPRYYSRHYTVHGTKGMYEEQTDSVFLDGDPDHTEWHKHWGNAKDYEEKYEHSIWRDFLKDGVRGGHGGKDWLVCEHFVSRLTEGKPFCLSVYDMAVLMCVTALSEKSIALGGVPVDFPDFTNGRWTLPDGAAETDRL